ncbi:VOC family protein [Microbispora siamensis]|nr:VOC family protein [Microbispora siamensis]
MPDLKAPASCQVTINVTDLAKSISFYQAAFDAVFNEETSSFQFGTWPSEGFFLLTVAHEPNEHGKHEGPAGVSRAEVPYASLASARGRSGCAQRVS